MDEHVLLSNTYIQSKRVMQNYTDYISKAANHQGPTDPSSMITGPTPS